MKISSVLPLAVVTPPVALALPLNTTDTCGAISQAFSAAKQANTTSSFEVPGSTAKQCLEAMPFDEASARDFLKEIRKYIAFQSTLEALQNPPKSYLSSPIDILGGLDEVAERKYNSQYEFDTNLINLIRLANDGHFNMQLCSLGIFSFSREAVRISSVSHDGIELPEIYTSHDTELLASGINSVSPVTSINGKKPAEFLNSVTKTQSFQDPDARYNVLFPSKAFLAGFGGLFAAGAFASNRGLWPESDITSLQFKNGSRRDFETVAKVVKDSFNATSGRGLYEAVCAPRGPPSKVGSNSSQPKPPAVKPSGPQGYPEPIIRDPFNQINGYYLDNETAVLFITSFEDTTKNQSKVFADVATKFVGDAITKGHNKLIIDVSGNAGGNIFRAFDLFKLFFPDKFPYSATRFRRHAAAESLASIFATLATFNKTLAQQVGKLSYIGQVTPDQTAGFESLGDFLGNTTQLGVPVSSLFANANYTSESSENQPIRGFGPIPLGNRTAPCLFKPENIIIIGDGTCTSTCTTFTNLMTNVGGVRTVAFGGRPKEEPMQIMGGVRGAQSLPFAGIDAFVAWGMNILTSAPNGTFSPQLILKLNNSAMPRGIANLPLVLSGGGVNFRNAYQESNSELPLQFEYQAADCRLFYTAQNIIKPSTMWTAAKEVIWGSKRCVRGSTASQGYNNGSNSNGPGGNGVPRNGATKEVKSTRSTRIIFGGVFAVYFGLVLL